jgi:hypothetical protein
MHGEQVLIPIAFFAMVAIVSTVPTYVRGMVKRWEREDAGGKITPDITARLERMEQAIEAIAVEVERISEGQRFTTKLLSEKEMQSLPVGGRRND